MTILAHACLGAGLHAIVGRVMYWPRRTRLYLALSGAVCGAGPDIMGWVGNLMGDEWTAYLTVHSGELSTYLAWIPAIGAHIALDSVVHPFPGWPQYIIAEVIVWVFGLILLWRTFLLMHR